MLYCINLSDYLTWNSLDKLREGSVCENLAEAMQSEIIRCYAILDESRQSLHGSCECRFCFSVVLKHLSFLPDHGVLENLTVFGIFSAILAPACCHPTWD